MPPRANQGIRFNFHWQIILLFAAGILLLAVVGSLTAGYLINNRVSDLVYDQAMQITKGFAHRSILPLLSGAGESALDDLESTLSYSNVTALGIYTAEGDLLIGTNQAEQLEFGAPVHGRSVPFEPELVKERESLWVFVAPVYDTDVLDSGNGSIDTLFSQTPSLLGYVSVTIDRSNLFAIQQALLQENLFVTVGIALLVLLIAVAITRRMVRPLYRFILLMNKAEMGDDSVRADLAGPVEIHNMSRAFNTMMQALESRRAYAEQQHASLLDEIEERAKIEQALRRSEKKLRALLAQHEAVVATVPGIILEIDQQGRPIWWNKRVEQVTGRSREEIAQSNVVEYIPPDLRAATLASIQQCIREGKAELHTDIFTLGGNIPYQFNSVRIDHPSGDESQATVLAIGMDESESVNAQIALAEARDAALESARIKSEFLANMSHEIRTPMNGMLGMLQLLGHSKLDAEQKKYADIALRSADQLMSIINDVLDFSKTEAGKLELHRSEFSFRGLVEEVVELFASKAYEKGLKIYADVALDVPSTIVTDSHRLNQILSNLVSNAVKFTDVGHVLVKAYITGSDTPSAALVFAVQDTGIGIEESARERVFDSFAQADGSSTRKYGGTGLGLAIVKQLCELLGGHIDMDSAFGEGSCFTVTLPLSSLEPDFNPVDEGRRLAQGLAVRYISSDRIQSTIFKKYCDRLNVDYRLIDPKGLHAAALEHGPNLAFIDAEYIADVCASEVWSRLAGVPVYVLVNLIESQSVDALVAHHGNVSKLVTPIRLETFLNVLTQESSEMSAEEEQAPAHEFRDRRQARILVVEDNDINMRVIVAMLDKLGHSVKLAQDGREALEVLEGDPAIEMVFMDCQMPGMDGYEATRRIRMNEAGGDRHVTIVAMTGNALASDREKCIAAGMDDYVAKPIRLATLKDTLDKWLTTD